MKLLFICLGAMMLSGCHDDIQEKQEVMDVARAETPLEKKNIKIKLPTYFHGIGGDSPGYNMFYVFDNGCSLCITKFIEIVHKFQSFKGQNFDNTRYFFIAMNKDTSKIRYYLDKYNISLSKNQYLLPDKNNEFVTLNPGIAAKNEVSYILTDSSYYPIVLGDPFYDFNSRGIYDSLGILKKHSGE